MLEPHRDGGSRGLPDPLGRGTSRRSRSRRDCLNSKPSRFGSVREALRLLRLTARGRTGSRIYGGGQFELGPGRSQIQHLASLFHPDAPNDVAPKGGTTTDRAEGPGLPQSPLPPFSPEEARLPLRELRVLEVGGEPAGPICGVRHELPVRRRTREPASRAFAPSSGTTAASPPSSFESPTALALKSRGATSGNTGVRPSLVRSISWS